jgi:hypothetical protein
MTEFFQNRQVVADVFAVAVAVEQRVCRGWIGKIDGRDRLRPRAQPNVLDSFRCRELCISIARRVRLENKFICKQREENQGQVPHPDQQQQHTHDSLH